MSILDFKKRVYKKDIFVHFLHFTEIKAYKFINITISSSKNDFLFFQLVGFPLLDDEKMWYKTRHIFHHFYAASFMMRTCVNKTNIT